jgi:N-acyl-D-aspartate/D-glutamate deacylase
MGDILALIEKEAARGTDVSFDAYPYFAASTGLRQLFPPWTHAGGPLALVARLQDPATRRRIVDEVLSGDATWDNEYVTVGPTRMILSHSRTGRWDGRSLSDVAHEMGIEPIEAAVDIVIAEEAQVSMIAFEMIEDDMMQAVTHRLCSICSDGSGYGLDFRGRPHPRNFGTFVHFLSEFALKRRLVSIEEAVRRMTSWPAVRASLKGRGTLAPGNYADVLVVDPANLAAPATFDRPKQYATGFKAVIVNGRVAVNNDALTGIRAGHVLHS